MVEFLEKLIQIIRTFLESNSKKYVSKIPKLGDKGPDVVILQEAINSYFKEETITVDGDFGSRTQGAISAIQKGNGLAGSGVIGPKTMRILKLEVRENTNLDTGSNMEKVFKIAQGEIGVTEIKGSKHNPRVLEYHATTGNFSTDEISWCGSFTSWCLKKAGLDTLGPEGAGARNWLKYGQETTNPVKGTIVIFWRESRTSWKGHVAFYSHETSTHIYVLGGNQGNTVKISAYPKSQFLGYRNY
jgi:uncharacterized protein (TIGR02594 family)